VPNGIDQRVEVSLRHLSRDDCLELE